MSIAAPLAGIRIADFSHVMAGPYATHILRMLGAEVIKIEPPGVGDPMRNYGGDRSLDGMAPGFVAVNAGKKSIALNLKDPEAQEVARKIIAQCDGVVENFRPGVMGRLSLSYDEVKEFAPQIIYCSVSGYGQTGTLRDWPAIDNIVQATSGMMSVSGEEGDPPVRVGFPIVDTLTGQTAALAMLAALLRRNCSEGGQGEFIDVSMFDASVGFMTSVVTPFLMTGQVNERKGNTGYSGQPTSAVFEAGDGRFVSMGVVQQHQFERLADVMGRQDWLSDPRFETPDLRRTNFGEMADELSQELRKRDASEWEAALSAAGVPCGMVREPQEAVRLPHLADRGYLIDVPLNGLEGHSASQLPGLGFSLPAGEPGVSQAPPLHGEHGAEILAWLGYKDELAMSERLAKR